MGHREELLEGAKRCLLQKGFVRTTARDIVKESGTNLASIGYHYGSKDALLAKAYIALIQDMGEAYIEPAATGGDAPPGSLEHFRNVWEHFIRSFPESRAIWLLSFEFILQGDRMPEVRRLLIEGQKEGRSGLLSILGGVPEADLGKEDLDTEGRFYMTILNGLMVQWLFDPDSATSADQLTEGLRRILTKAAAHAAPADGVSGGPSAEGPQTAGSAPEKG